ncbi:phosphomannomutase [Thermochromatium tepidum]|uniref:Phosphomannomutase n=1 Tax=Thermochromatium tepidum ATCC 43061 TaxID=316276 RepID=A0A6I6EGI3_THETI|nr:phosphomannomutase [Thermochromatium tepidum]QGU33320.1 phosphomannomutase [Thermochromatium tepidum ATCC 43061]
MQISDLMAESGVGFGTSGARGLVERMTDWVCYAYTCGFLSYLTEIQAFSPGQAVGIGGDLRPSTPRIMVACARAVRDQGGQPINLGLIPSPAVAGYGLGRSIPTLMVTGSHIPADRNGIKFNLPSGEILKPDEEGIRAQTVVRPEGLFDADGAFSQDQTWVLPAPDDSARDAYIARYLDFFPRDCLKGLRVGVYEHSSVARDPLSRVLSALGAEVTRLGRSDTFIPVDTEAVRPEDQARARDWAASGRFDALISADGDGDRPLIADERGRWLRGDLTGVLCARRLGIRALATPVSSNTLVERCGSFEQVLRTRIGSPFVIEGMRRLIEAGLEPVAGYEANGGFLLASALVNAEGGVLSALPTRDALLVAVTILIDAVERGQPVSALADGLPQRFTHSDRLKDFPTELSRARLAALNTGNRTSDKVAIEATFGKDFGPIATLDDTDGLRLTFESGEILHLRPSGNAPELRAYAEADSPERAEVMVRMALETLATWR